MTGRTRYSILWFYLFCAAIRLSFGWTADAFAEDKQNRLPEGAERSAGQRIITMSPAITEIVFALNSGDRVVATSDFRTFPPEARALEKVGGAINPNFEKITALKPTLIIIQGVNDRIADFCSLKKIPFFRVKLDTMEDITVAIQRIGEKIGREKEAGTLIRDLEEKISAIRMSVAERKRPKVFLSLHHVPGSLARMTTVGPGSFFQDAVEAAGGENIFADLKILYPAVSKETLVKRQPDIIVEMLYDPSMKEEGRRILIGDWQMLPGIPAVREKRVVIMDDDFSLIPGPRVHLLVEKLARIFHPDTRPAHE